MAKRNNVAAVCLNPYSNGMKIEQNKDYGSDYGNLRLNPYSNGMKIELIIKFY